MADVTKAELRTRVLQHLGVIAAGETASAADALVVDNAIVAVIDGELTQTGALQGVFTSDLVPNWSNNSLRDVVAFRVAPEFGIMGQQLAELMTAADAGIQFLLKHLDAVTPADTKPEIAGNALRALGVAHPGEVPSTADLAIANDAFDEFFDWLDEVGTRATDFNTATTIAQWAKPFFRDAIAFRLAPQFSIDPNRMQVLQQKHDIAVARLISKMDAPTPGDTKVEVRNSVLYLVNVLAPGEEPTAAQADLVDTAIDKFHDWLDEVGTLPSAISTVTALEDWAKPLYRDVVAYRVAPQFAVVDARLQELQQRHNVSLAELISRLGAPQPADSVEEVRNDALYALGVVPPGAEPTAVQADIVDDILEQYFDLLDERATVGFTLATIPDWAKPMFRDIVAADAAPQFGVIDPNRLNILQAKRKAAESELSNRFSATGATGTKTILRNRILQHLGIIGVAETPTAAQIEVVEEIIDQGFDHLVTDGAILPNVTLTTLPDYTMLPLRNHFAYMCSGIFGLGVGKKNNLFQEHRIALKVLYGQVQDREAPNTDSVEATYY